MKVEIKVFASARELANAGYIQLAVPDNILLSEIKALLDSRYPALKGMPGRWAVNLELARFDCPVKPGDELAWIPPVSGG